MHSSSGLCQILNINESIILCQEVTVGTAAHSWTGTRSSVDLSRRCIHLKENPVTESVGEGIMVCYAVKHLLIFHHKTVEDEELAEEKQTLSHTIHS